MSREHPSRPVVGVGAVILRDDRVLLVRRGRPPRAGQWSLPGGAQKLGETVEEAVRREIREETGLELARIELLAVVDSIHRDPDGRIRYHYTLIDVLGEAAPGEVRPGDDAQEVAWFPLSELERLDLWDETLRVIRLASERRSGAQSSLPSPASARARLQSAS